MASIHAFFSQIRGANDLRDFNNITLGYLPLNHFSINGRLELRGKFALNLDLVAQPITLGDSCLVNIPEQSLVPLNRVAWLFEQRRNGDRVMEAGR